MYRVKPTAQRWNAPENFKSKHPQTSDRSRSPLTRRREYAPRMDRGPLYSNNRIVPQTFAPRRSESLKRRRDMDVPVRDRINIDRTFNRPVIKSDVPSRAIYADQRRPPRVNYDQSRPLRRDSHSTTAYRPDRSLNGRSSDVRARPAINRYPRPSLERISRPRDLQPPNRYIQGRSSSLNRPSSRITYNGMNRDTFRITSQGRWK